MAAVLKIGQTALDAPTLIAKLGEYQLMPKLVQSIIVESAIATIECEAPTALQDFWTKRGVFSLEQQQSWCQQQQQSPEDVTLTAIREYKLSQFQEETWGTQIESYFLQRKSKLDRVCYSLIRTEDANLAQEIYFRLNDDGASFSELATQYSAGQEAKTGGLVGPVELSIPHPILARMLMLSKPGQLWAPTKIGEWFVIVRLEDFLPAQIDSKMRQRLLLEQFQAWLQKTLKETLVQAPESNAPTTPKLTISHTSQG